MWKLAKKGDFRILFCQIFGVLQQKSVPKIGDSHILWKLFATKFMIDCKTEIVFSWFFIGTVWTLLHNQTNQTNCWKRWKFLGFLRKIQISIDDSLCLIIICSHFVSIKSRKIRVFSKFSKNPVILPYKYLYLILLITKKPGHI